MKLNLRKARKLETKISNHLQGLDLKLTTPVRIKGSPEDATNAVLTAGQRLVLDLEQATQLNNLRYAIRLSIAQVNEASGINTLMNQREQLKAQAALLIKLQNPTLAPSSTELADILAANSANLDKGNHYGQVQVTTEVSVVSELVRKSLNDNIAITLKGLEDIEDQLAQKNLGAGFELSEDGVKLLQSVGLL